MVATIAVVLGVVVIGLVVVPWLMKAVADMDKAEETHLHDPETPTISYEVPNGVDAAVLCTALDEAGHSSVLEFVRGEERLLIESRPAERESIRRVLADATERAYGTQGMVVGAVRVTDER